MGDEPTITYELRDGVITFKCGASGCRWPFLRLVDGAVVVMSDHFGTKHMNSVPLGLLVRLAEHLKGSTHDGD